MMMLSVSESSSNVASCSPWTSAKSRSCDIEGTQAEQFDILVDRGWSNS